jgi:uncharacterized protein (TIGR03435 family)
MILIVAVLFALTDVPAVQQPPAPVSFEVASIRQNISGLADSSLNTPPTGVVTGTNIPVRQLILAAYRVHRTRLIGGPDWISDERYDVLAKRPDNVPADQLPRLWESFLRDRLKLRVHTETRELPVYRLVIARRDGKLGPRLMRATIDCPAMTERPAPLQHARLDEQWTGDYQHRGDADLATRGHVDVCGHTGSNCC